MIYIILRFIIFYILPLIFSYYLIRNFHYSGKHIKPDLLDVVMTIVPIINIIVIIVLFTFYLEDNSEKLAKKFFRLK